MRYSESGVAANKKKKTAFLGLIKLSESEFYKLDGRWLDEDILNFNELAKFSLSVLSLVSKAAS